MIFFFYYRIASEMIFIIKMLWNWFLLWKGTGNDFYYENASEMILV